MPRVVDAEDTGARRPRARSPTCGSSPLTTSCAVGQRGDGVPPAGGDELELAVAVELVAEEVAEQERLRPDAARDLRQRRLVDLEQPELGAAGGEEGGGDPGDEIGA